MNSDPINIDDINIDCLELSLPKKESGNQMGKMFYILHNKSKLRIILPELSLPYGAGNSDKFPDKFTMCVSFDGMAADDKRGARLTRAHEKLTKINEKIFQLILDNRTIVFKDKKKVSDEILASRYKTFIHSDESKPDFMYLSLQKKRVSEKDALKMTEAEKVEHMKHFIALPEHGFMIDPKGNQVNVTTENIKTVIPWGSRVKPVAEFAYIWVPGASQDCYPVWTFVHGLLVSTKAISNFSLLNKDDGDDEEEADDNEETDEDGDEVQMDAEDEMLANAQMN